MSQTRDIKGLTVASARAFSLIEMAIVVMVIGIIAAVAIPRMSRGSCGAADSAVSLDLALLRNAIDMYQSDHDGQYPVPSGSVTVAELLLQYSDRHGQNVSAAKSARVGTIVYGPYLRSIPAISVGTNKGGNGIAVSTASGVTASGGPGIGWLYNSADGTIEPYTGAVSTDSSGRLYASY